MCSMQRIGFEKYAKNKVNKQRSINKNCLNLIKFLKKENTKVRDYIVMAKQGYDMGKEHIIIVNI